MLVPLGVREVGRVWLAEHGFIRVRKPMPADTSLASTFTMKMLKEYNVKSDRS